ncbi:hypothetical protein [Aegicerativicinus sediminis]
MNQYKKAGLAGALISLIYFFYNIYLAFKITQGFPFSETLSEILTAIFAQIPLLLPAIVLVLFTFKKKISNWVIWLYPAVITIGLLNVLLSDDALSAGLPMIIFVYPFCVIYAVILFLLRKKSEN